MGVFTVFASALVTAITTGLGAIPAALLVGPTVIQVEPSAKAETSHPNPAPPSGVPVPVPVRGASNALAAGMMLAASLLMLHEGAEHNALTSIVGAFLGWLLLLVSRRFLDSHELSIENLSGADARKALLIVGVMFLHSFAEGISIGVSFGHSNHLATVVTTGLAVHNIPEGLAISLVLVRRGVTPFRASLWSIFSSLPQPLMAVPAYLFVHAFMPVLPVGLGFAAGAMIAVAVFDLIPEAREDLPALHVHLAWIVAATVILFLYF